MHVGAAYDWQEVQLTRAHAVQGQVKRVVRMDVWKIVGDCDFTQPTTTKTIVVEAFQFLQADDANHAAFLANGPRAKFAGPRFLQGFLNGHLRAQYFRDLAHRMNHLPLNSLLARLCRRQVDAILVRQDLIDRLLLESPGNEKTHQVGNHEWHDHCIVSCNFEDHHHGGHRRAHDPGKCRAHPHQCVSAGRADVIRQKVIGYVSDNPTKHGPKKQAWSEDSTRVTGGVAGN